MSFPANGKIEKIREIGAVHAKFPPSLTENSEP
jgi:hypothetical protein